MSVRWVNWAGDQSCRPTRILRPRSRDELAEAVAAAASAGEKVRVAGSGHSFTEAALTEETMIRLEALSGVLDADRESGLVRVGGGTVLADLNEQLAGLGLAMENLGDIDRQTIAGAIPPGPGLRVETPADTPPHTTPGAPPPGPPGPAPRLRNISAQVEGLELVLG